MREPRPRRSPPCKQPMTTEKHGRQWRRRTNSSSRAAKLLSSCSGVPSLQPVKALLAGATTSFSEDEEELLIKLHALLGNRWSIIAGRLPGRTGEEVEAHWGTPAMRRRTGGADPDNHRVLLQALLASSHDQQGEHLPRAVPNRVRQERPGRPSSSDGDRDDDDCALSDADSRWCLAQVNLELTLSTPCSTST